MAGIFTQTCLKGSKDSPARARSSRKIWAEGWAKKKHNCCHVISCLVMDVMGMILRPFHSSGKERQVNGAPHIWLAHGNPNESWRYDVVRCYQC
jgi:hypothetical protein